MNDKERLINVISGKPVDRLPVMTWMSSFAQEKYIAHYGISREEMNDLINPDSAYLSMPCKFLGETKSPDGEADYYDEFGVGWRSEPGDVGPINTVAPIKNREDIKNYRFPDVETQYSFDDVASQIAKHKDSAFLVAYQATGTFFNKYRFLRGFEEGLIDMMLNQEEVEYLLDMLLEYQLAIARKFITLGVDAVNTGDDVALQHGLVVNPDVWRKLIKPRQKKLNEIYKSAGLHVIHHCCGDCRSIIKDYIETGVDCLNPVQPEAMPIEDLAKEYGSCLTFYGGVGVQSVMQHGTPEDVDKAVERTIKILGAHGRYIIGASHTIQDCIPCENMHAYFEAIAKYNR
ncbi:MAG: uroporphyrinogen decarboxylase family protein [Victivallales bacterium]